LREKKKGGSPLRKGERQKEMTCTGKIPQDGGARGDPFSPVGGRKKKGKKTLPPFQKRKIYLF